MLVLNQDDHQPALILELNEEKILATACYFSYLRWSLDTYKNLTYELEPTIGTSTNVFRY